MIYPEKVTLLCPSRLTPSRCLVNIKMTSDPPFGMRERASALADVWSGFDWDSRM